MCRDIGSLASSILTDLSKHPDFQLFKWERNKDFNYELDPYKVACLYIEEKKGITRFMVTQDPEICQSCPENNLCSIYWTPSDKALLYITGESKNLLL